MICPFCGEKHSDRNYIGTSRCTNCNRSFSIFYAKGKELLGDKKYDEAIENFLKALKTFKNTANIYIDLAKALNHLSTDAIQKRNDALIRAIEIDDEMSIEFIKGQGWDITSFPE